MKVLIYRVGEEPEIREVKDELEELQGIVGGLIEYFYPFTDWDIAIICNEEGKLNELKPNKVVNDDVICGDFLVVRTNRNGGSEDLTDEDIELVKSEIEEFDDRDYYPCFDFITY